MPFGKSKRISNFKEKLEKNKRSRYQYFIHQSERNFLRNNFGRNLLKLTKTNAEGLYLSGGIYSLYDPLEEQEYFYFDPIQVRYQDIRFVVNQSDEIEYLINVKKDEFEEPTSGYDSYYISRGIDGALTFIMCDEYETR